MSKAERVAWYKSIEERNKKEPPSRQVETQVSDPVRYEIETVEDFAKVPAKKLGLCLEKFRLALEAHKLANELCEEVGKQIDSKTKARLEFTRFVWIDDGKGKIEININGRGGQLDTVERKSA